MELSLIILLMLEEEALRDMGGLVLLGMLQAVLASESAKSLPKMLECPGIHWILTSAQLDIK